MARSTPDILAGLGQGEDDVRAAMGPAAERIATVHIRLDGGTQPRAGIDQAVVDDYYQDMQAGATFPPVELVYDGEVYWLWDGFHRFHAWRMDGDRAILAHVRQGTRRDAVLLSVGANATHGFRRTNADKRRSVLALLEDEEWGQWSDREIGRRCAVSHTLVANLRAELSGNGCQIETRRVERNGTEYTMTPAQRTPAPAVASQGDNWATSEELAAAVRGWLVAYDTRDEQEAALVEVIELGEGSVTFDDLREWIDVKPRRTADLIQAAGRVLIEVRWEMAAEEPGGLDTPPAAAATRPAPVVPVDIEEHEVDAVVSQSREERMAAALEYDRQRKELARCAVDTFVAYAEKHGYTGVLRWLAYRIHDTAQWDDLAHLSRHELWRLIGQELIGQVVGRQDKNTSLERVRDVIDERFSDAGLNGVLWPEDGLR